MEKLVDVDAQRLAQLIGHKEGRTELAAFEACHVVRREPGGLGELHLRPTARLTSAPDALPDGGGECTWVVGRVTDALHWPRARDRALLHCTFNHSAILWTEALT